MGSNGRKNEARREFDFYPTPRWMTDLLLDRLPLEVPPGAWGAGCRCDGADIVWGIRNGERVEGPYHERACPAIRPPRILDPCVGEGNIVSAVAARYPTAIFQTNDLDPRHPADAHEDATDPAYWARFDDMLPKPDWTIMNTPWSAAFPIIRHAFEVSTIGVAALLRCTWGEPLKGPKGKAKAYWLRDNPLAWELKMERYSFDRSGGQDSAPPSWFVWSKYALPTLPGALPQRIEIIPGRGEQGGLL